MFRRLDAPSQETTALAGSRAGRVGAFSCYRDMKTATVALLGVCVVAACSSAVPTPASPDASAAATPRMASEAVATPIETPVGSPTTEPTASLPAPTWHNAGSMVTPRRSHDATLLLDGRVLVTGGLDGGGDYVVEAELYDPQGQTWTDAGLMSEGRRGHTATLLLDGSVLIVGGWSDRDEIRPSKTIEIFDPVTATSTIGMPLAERRAGHSATLLLDGRVLVAGGLSYNGGNGSPLDTVELYDPQDRTWTAMPSMVEARGAHTATLLQDGTVLVVGGIGTTTEETAPVNTTMTSAERFDPEMKRWRMPEGLHEGRAGHTASLLVDGTVLVTRMGSQGTAERFDPTAGVFSTIADMETVRFGHTSTVLTGGQVLVIGGSGASGAAIGQTAEWFDPATGTWSGTAAMRWAREGHTATLLLDGGVLVVGGMDEGGGLVAATERYEPGSGP